MHTTRGNMRRTLIEEYANERTVKKEIDIWFKDKSVISDSRLSIRIECLSHLFLLPHV